MKEFKVFCVLVLLALLCGCKQEGRAHSSDIDNNNGDKCPRCSSRNIGRWEFGLAPSVPEEEIKSGRVHVGGCVVYEDAPQYHCNDCGYDWGKWKMQNDFN